MITLLNITHKIDIKRQKKNCIINTKKQHMFFTCKTCTNLYDCFSNENIVMLPLFVMLKFILS